MRERSLLIIAIAVILCAGLASASIFLTGDDRQNDTNNTTEANNSTNISLNQTNNTTNNTTTEKTTKSTTKTTAKSGNTKTKENSDPDYDPSRDASHKHATESNPVTVQQSDGEYTYYGPGHYDYYAGPTHMSGGHYKEMNSRSY